MFYTVHKQTSYRLHDEHLFRNYIKVHVTVGVRASEEKKDLSSFEIEM